MVALIVGQSLFWVPSSNRGRSQARNVSVVKVGRKWAVLSNHQRIDVGNLVADGGAYSSPGRCYLRQEEYEQEVALRVSWQALVRDMRDVHGLNAPAGVSIADIDKARALLRL